MQKSGLKTGVLVLNTENFRQRSSHGRLILSVVRNKYRRTYLEKSQSVRTGFRGVVL